VNLRSGRRNGTKIRAVRCIVNGYPVHLIVDTGASRSIMYENQTRLCKCRDRVDTSPEERITFSTIQDARAHSLGILRDVEMRLGTVCGHVTFIVMAGACRNGLLGIDWLDAHGALIDVAHDCMHVGNEVIPFVDPCV
jgi:predicted aspartyl protease